jgi:ABC-type uncharacterized transport system fused permease/ATPase subunit
MDIGGSLRKAIAGKNAAITASTVAVVAFGAYLARKKRKQLATDTSSSSSSSALRKTAHDAKALSRSGHGQVNMEFVRQLRELLAIAMPGVASKEFLLLLLHTAFLVSRTFLSIEVSKLDGAIVKSIVSKRGSEFIWNLAKWLGLAIPATYINSMIRFLESKLAIAFRTRMSQHFYQQYMANDTYYRVGNLDGRLSNADQCLTEDVARFCANVAHVHSQVSKPLLDVVLMGGQLVMLANNKTGHGTAAKPAALAILIIYLTIKVLRWFTPPFGELVAEQARLEGNYRYTHSRLITNAEEIAFYGGHEIEQRSLTSAYLQLVKHMNSVFRLRILHGMVEGFFMKYVCTCTCSLSISQSLSLSLSLCVCVCVCVFHSLTLVFD